MVKIVFVQQGGAWKQVEAREGLSVMEVAVKNNVPGIDADCGGACACATCHVYVDEAWLEKLEAQATMESSMLEFAADVEPRSRLACQIKVHQALDGLTVYLPASQH
jgi:2Fe-2S ferredoxin